jgi:hypothetical protein
VVADHPFQVLDTGVYLVDLGVDAAVAGVAVCLLGGLLDWWLALGRLGCGLHLVEPSEGQGGHWAFVVVAPFLAESQASPSSNECLHRSRHSTSLNCLVVLFFFLHIRLPPGGLPLLFSCNGTGVGISILSAEILEIALVGLGRDDGSDIAEVVVSEHVPAADSLFGV